MASKVTYLCDACGYVAPSYLGRCPECQAWNSFSEQVSIKAAKPGALRSRSGSLLGSSGLGQRSSSFSTAPSSPASAYATESTSAFSGFPPLPGEPIAALRLLSEVQMEEAPVRSSGFAELDRVLGGGILPGSYVLIGGDPGIGKSTLMLQVASAFGSQKDRSGLQLNRQTGELMPVIPAASEASEAFENKGFNATRQGSSDSDDAENAIDIKATPVLKPVLYVAGEESAYQVRLRAERLQADTTVISVLAATDIHTIAQVIRQTRPPLAIIDSIQSVYCPEAPGTPGSVSQIRECAAILMELAKGLNVPIFLIGHVTKEGAVAGPKVLEHTVDAVLYFEGEKYQNLRILRAVKNRFGSTQEIGVFEMAESGLQEIDNPSALFLANGATGQPGSVIAATLEGSRPLLVEIQALVGQSTYPSPRRVGNGIDYNRLHQIVAVLERRLGLDFSRQDIYVNVVGGLRIDEPAADLAVAIAIISSTRDLPVIAGTAVAGEIGLTGEIRAVSQIERRQREAARIGLSRMLVPSSRERSEATVTQVKKSSSSKSGKVTEEAFSIDSIPVATLADSVKACFAPKDWSKNPSSFESLPPIPV